MTLHTHYDNLKVARNAPPEVIKAAYKAMAQKWHPDKNPGNPEALRVMRLINEAYDVLSVPTKRADHDQWILIEEELQTERAPARPSSRPSAPAPAPVPPPAAIGFFRASGYLVGWAFRNWWLFLIGFGAVALYAERAKPYVPLAVPTRPTPRPEEPAAPLANLAPAPPLSPPTKQAVPAYERPFLAPNGEMWPVIAGYLRETPIRATGGLSTFTVDNTRNDSDVHAKLFVAGTKPPSEVRQAYIPAYGSFSFKELAPNLYDLRTMDLNTGAMTRSEAFSIVQTETDDGVRYSNSSITLYKVVNGNSRSYEISQGDFTK